MIQTENDIRCNICGGKKFKIIGPTQGGFYNRCLNCGVENRISSPDSNIKKDFETSQKTCYTESDQLESPSLSVFQRNAAQERMKLIKKFLMSGKLLEIGPGGGEFMLEAKKAGMEVVGVEHSPVATQRLSHKLGLSVECGAFEDFNFENKFDAIVNMHVIEHVIDPALHLSNARRALKKNGFLFLGTPNLNSWSRVMAGNKWQGYTPAHQNLFGFESMRQLLSNDWEIINFSTIEAWENLPWTLLSMTRSVKAERSLNQGGKVSKSMPSGLLKAANFLIRPATWPFRKIQEVMLGGSELIVIAKPR